MNLTFQIVEAGGALNEYSVCYVGVNIYYRCEGVYLKNFNMKYCTPAIVKISSVDSG